MAAPALSISARALAAVRWNYLGTAGRIAAQFVSQILLARLLGPEPTGLFAYAFLTVSLAALCVEMGLGAALVQALQLDERDIDTATARLLWVGVLAAVGIYAAADVLAATVFATPQAAPIIRAMAPSLLISAIIFPASAMLRRELRFAQLQGAELGSYLFGYLIVGVASAVAGLGVWSLVLAWYAQSASNALALQVLAWRRPRLAAPWRRLSLSRFGVVVMATNLLNWTIEQGTHVAVGRFFGAAALGQFTLSNNLVRTPANHLVVSLQSVLFPMAARAQRNDAGLRRAYLTALGGVGLVAFPLFAFVAVAAAPIVLLLLGPAWSEAARVLTPLAAAMVPHAAMALCGPLLNGRGQPEVELRLQACTLAAMALVLAITSQYSLVVMAWGLAGVYAGRCVLMTWMLLRRLQIGAAVFAVAVRGPLLLAALAVLAGLGAEPALRALALPVAAVTVLAAAAMGAALAIGLALAVVPSLVLGPHLLALIDMAVQARPSVAAWPGLRRIARLATALPQGVQP